MNVSFQHLNPWRGHDSTLLTFSGGVSDQSTHLLVDAGMNVDIDGAIPDGEHLAATLLTHAHLDHYRTLAANARDGAPVYTTAATANLLEQVLSESEKHHDVGEVDAVIDRVQPIDGFTRVGRNVEISPLPAGHVPGAASFVVRFSDGDRRRHVLLSGDFTFRRAAGYPGFPDDLPFDVDVLFVNAATDDGFESTVTDVVGEALELANAGKPVLVTAGGLTGLHLAYVLGHAGPELGRSVPVRLVGQAAKLYDLLEYDVANVSTARTFTDPSDQIEPNTITIAGPEVPIEGSAKRLFEVIKDDPSAALVQVTTSGLDPVSSASCTVSSYELSNHSTPGCLDRLVSNLQPIHVVLKHTRRLDHFKERYDASFVWANDDCFEQTLYADGEWIAPPWMSEHGVRAVRGSRDTFGDLFPSGEFGSVTLPKLDRYEEVDLAAEGLHVDELGRTTPPEQTTMQTGSSGENSTIEVTDGGDGATSAAPSPATEPAQSGTDEVTSSEFERTVTDRLDAIEQALSGQTVEARVVDAGDGLILFRPLDAMDLEDGRVVELVVRDVEE